MEVNEDRYLGKNGRPFKLKWSNKMFNSTRKLLWKLERFFFLIARDDFWEIIMEVSLQKVFSGKTSEAAKLHREFIIVMGLPPVEMLG